jgi:conjugation system TraG family ATPase
VFTEEKVESIVTLITALWKKETEITSRSEDVSLEIAIDEYLKTIQLLGKKSGSFNEFYEFVGRDLQRIFEERKNLNVRQDHFDFEGFKIALSPFYKGGKFELLLNSTGNIDLLNKRFVVFELDNIKDNKTLLPVVTIIIMEMFVNKMRRLGAVRKMILIEEAWKAIARDSMAEYIKYLFKTVRKFQGEAIVVTQEVDDIIGSEIVKNAIINNSDCKIMLDSRKYMNNFEPIANLLGLTEKQRSQILSINRNNDPKRIYKEVFIGLGSESAVYAVEVSMQQYYTFTTELSEKIMVQQEAKKCGGDYQLAISNHCGKIKENLKNQ